MPFITVIDAVFQGRVASWRDDDGKPVVYMTEAEAQVDANDVMEGDEPDGVEQVSVTSNHIIGTFDGRIYWARGDKQCRIQQTRK